MALRILIFLSCATFAIATIPVSVRILALSASGRGSLAGGTKLQVYGSGFMLGTSQVRCLSYYKTACTLACEYTTPIDPQGSARLFIGNDECIQDRYESTDTLFTCYTPPAPGRVPSTQRVAMYLTGLSQGYSSAQCDYATCQFYYSAQWTPVPGGYTSLGGSGGSLNRLYRAYGLIYGATADVTADSNYNIKQGGYTCITDPSRQTYSSGTSIVSSSGYGIVKW